MLRFIRSVIDDFFGDDPFPSYYYLLPGRRYRFSLTHYWQRTTIDGAIDQYRFYDGAWIRRYSSTRTPTRVHHRITDADGRITLDSVPFDTHESPRMTLPASAWFRSHGYRVFTSVGGPHSHF